MTEICQDKTCVRTTDPILSAILIGIAAACFIAVTNATVARIGA